MSPDDGPPGEAVIAHVAVGGSFMATIIAHGHSTSGEDWKVGGQLVLHLRRHPLNLLVCSEGVSIEELVLYERLPYWNFVQFEITSESA
jgi:hypothetical protein